MNCEEENLEVGGRNEIAEAEKKQQRHGRCVGVREYVKSRMTRYDNTAYLSTNEAENTGGFIFSEV